jgi:hypothetical protein
MIRNGCVPVKITALRRSCVVCVRINSINFVLFYTVTTVHKFRLRFVIIRTPSKYLPVESHTRRNRDGFWQNSGLQDRPLKMGPCLRCRGESRRRESTRASAGTCSCRRRRPLTHNEYYATGKVIVCQLLRAFGERSSSYVQGLTSSALILMRNWSPPDATGRARHWDNLPVVTQRFGTVLSRNLRTAARNVSE